MKFIVKHQIWQIHYYQVFSQCIKSSTAGTAENHCDYMHICKFVNTVPWRCRSMNEVYNETALLIIKF